MTVQKYVVGIVSKLKDSISYYKECEIEIAQVETVNKYHQTGILLHLLPETSADIVLTNFSVDNLDKAIGSKKVVEWFIWANL